MSRRLPTVEEKRLWRDDNKHTQKHQPDDAEAEFDDEELHETEAETLPVATKIAAPPPAQKSLPPLALLDTREAKKYRNSHPYVQATLDLHGITRLDARELVQQFISRNYRQGRRHVLIITGKGRVGEGVLRQELPRWLNEPGLRPMLASLFNAAPRDGGNGALHIILKKPQ